MNGADQLIYTWASSGLTGRSGLQPVAATPRLADRDQLLTQQALTLCGYTPPRGVEDPLLAPVAFGWKDRGDTRFVFHRAYAGRDGAGRPGNFYAHVLAGPRRSLPVAGLAARFGSDFWWRGEAVSGPLPANGRLERVALTDIAETSDPVDEDDLIRFTDAVLASRCRIPLVLHWPPATTAALVRHLADRLPGVFESVSLSTYEPATHASGYDIVGMAAADTRPRGALASDSAATPDQSLLRARTLVLSDEPRSSGLVGLALAGSACGDGTVSLDHLLRTLPVFERLAAGERTRPELVVPGLGRPGTASFVLGLSEGLRAAAGALADGSETAWQAVASVQQGLDGEDLARLGRAVGEQMSATLPQGGPAGLASFVGRSRALRPEFAGPCLSAVLERADGLAAVLRGVDQPTRMVLLRQAAAMPTAPAAAVDALLACSGEHALEVAGAGHLPIDWRGRALSLAAEGTPGPAVGTARAVSSLLRADHDLLCAFARALADPGRLVTALLPDATAPADEATARLALSAARALDTGRFALLEAVSARLPTGRVLRFVGAARLLTADARWGPVAAAAVAARVNEAHAQDHDLAPSADEADILRSIGAPDTAPWSAALETLGVRGDPWRATPRKLARYAASLLRAARAEPDAARRVALTRLVLVLWLRTGNAPHGALAEVIAAERGTDEEAALAARLLDAARHVGLTSLDWDAPRHALCAVASCQDRYSLLNGPGRTSAAALRRTGVELAQAMPTRDRAFTAHWIAANSGRRGRGWWRSVTREARVDNPSLSG